MDFKESQLEPYVEAYVPSYSPLDLGKFFQPKGNYDGKIHCTDERVTYTFLDHEEVITLHYDKNRKELFYKGHQVTNLTITTKEKEHIEKFLQALKNHPEAKNFIDDFVKLRYLR